MLPRIATVIVCSLVGLGCGGDNGGSGSVGKTCADVFTAAIRFAGQEVVTGCYYPGTYSITASISQTKGTCDALFDWQSVSGSAHECSATLSGDATGGYNLDFSTCSLPGSIHVAGDLSTFTGQFNWTVSCGSGTTVFQNISKQ